MLFSTRSFLSGAYAAILCWGIFAGVSPAEAQTRQPQQQAKVPITLDDCVFRSMTKIQQGYVLELESIVGEKWKCLVTPQSQITATGEAEKELLKKGVYVSFEGTVKLKKATVEAEISEVTVFTPDARRAAGVFQPWSAEPLYVPPKERKQKSEPAVGMNFSSDAGGGTQKKQKPPEEMELTLRGSVTTVAKTGAATVTMPANPYFKGAVKCHFAEEMTVHAVLGGGQTLQFLKSGDKVSVSGDTHSAATMSMEAKTVEIIYGEKIGAPAKKK